MKPVTLWAHQQKMLDFTLSRFRDGSGYVLIHAGCATGKTLYAYSLAEAIGAKRTLVITTKAGITSAWVREHERWCDNSVIIAPTKGKVIDRAAQVFADTGGRPMVYVVNYESAWRMAGTLRAGNFDLVIADECHKLQSPSSKQSMGIARVCAAIPYKVAMTGTAWADRPTQVFGQVRFLDPLVYGKGIWSRVFGRWAEFRQQFTFTRTTRSGREFVAGYRNQARLSAMLSDFTLLIDSEDVLDLPSYQDIERPVTMTAAIRKPYMGMYNDMIAQLKEGNLTAAHKLTQFLRLQQLSRGHHPMGLCAQPSAIPSIQEVISILDEIGNEPAVIFTQFTPDVELLKGEIEKTGKTVKKLVGGCHEHVEWQAGDGDIIIANMAAGSEAVELTRARYAIYYSKGFSRTQYEQSRYRVRRPTSTRPITYFHIIVEGALDRHIQEMLKDKGDIAQFIEGRLLSPKERMMAYA